MERLELTQQQLTPLQLEGAQERVIERLKNLHHTPTEEEEAQQDELRQEDIDPNGWQKTEIVTSTEENFAKRAFERARVLVKEKAQAYSCNARRIGTVAAASLAITGGYTAAQEVIDKLPTAAAAEIDYGTGGYPWAEAPIGSRDDEGHLVRECSSYVSWKLKSVGVDLERTINARLKGEVVNKTPAAGAVAEKPNHVMYVESVSPDGTYFTVSEYNGYAGRYKFGIRNIQTSEIEAQQIEFVHFELPAPEGKPFFQDGDPETYMNTTYDKRNKNTISTKRSVLEGNHLSSENDRYKLVVKKGNIKLYDTEEGDSVKWQASASKKAAELRIERGKGKQKGKNTLTFSTNHLVKFEGSKKAFRMREVYKRWNIGPATTIKIDDDGELVGYKGKQKVWNAKSMKAVPRVAKLSMSKISSKRAKALGR